jgi:hypothetical protein
MEQTFSNHSHGSSGKLLMNSTSGICYLELGSAAHPFLNENNYESYLQGLRECASLGENKISGVVTSSREITRV